MSVEIGINPITWTNDDLPELGGDIPLETCLSEASQAGYAGIEMGGKFPRNAAELGPLLSRHGLHLVSGWYDGRICDREIGEEFDADPAAPDPSEGPRLQGRGLCRHVARPA